ncbi:hypothetical protein F4861DRAFT_550409 [Xylaria intraflava]|nr:hypothetical protein F4861DRAFT_550409 [Xylaria intraflava]
MDSKKRGKYHSRILREMRNQVDQPWSPPTSTGSHGTVTLTSEFTHNLDPEPARPPMPKINTSVLARTFPEWKNYGKYGKENEKPTSPEIINDSHGLDLIRNDDLRERTRVFLEKCARPDASRPLPRLRPGSRYLSTSTSGSRAASTSSSASSRSSSGSFPALSTTSRFSKTSSIFGSQSPRLRAHQTIPVTEESMEPLPLPKLRGNVTTLLSTLQTARSETSEEEEESMKQAELDERVATMGPPPQRTVHSFFLPDLNHINDFVSGTLRWSSLKNGTPIFVKHGKVHDRETTASQDHHADFEAVTVPQEEEEIFVSLDKIREEIQTLQEHDGFISQHADELRTEICHLQNRIAQLEFRKDSAVGSESDGSMIVQLTAQKSQLEEKIASLKTQLDQANHKIGLSDVHNQSFVIERDQALQRASDHVITIKRLQARNDAITQEKLELQGALRHTEEDLSSERELLDTLRHKYDMVTKEKSLLKEDHLSLERQNDDLYNNNRSLQQKNTVLERENTHLQDKVAQLQDLIEELELAQKSQASRYTRESKSFTPGLAQSKTTGISHIQGSRARRSPVAEMSTKMASGMHSSSQDNDTRESELSRESRQYTQESRGSMAGASRPKATKSTQVREPRDINTVMSEMSAKTTTSYTGPQTQDDYAQQINLTRESQVEVEDNMTSALFIDDVTLDSNKKFPQKQKAKNAVRVLSPILSVAEPTTETVKTAGKQKDTTAAPILTQSAKCVLDNLCQDHECYNCVLCARIRSRHETTGKYPKKTVRVDRPVPVTDRKKGQSVAAQVYEDQPTLRPSQDPAIALAKVMKGLKDEERHIRFAISKKQAVYDECDPSFNKRLWKQLDAEIRVLRKRRDLKRDQIYDLHDVLEGQKANAQLMSQEAIDMTITSVLSKDPTWNGTMEF